MIRQRFEGETTEDLRFLLRCEVVHDVEQLPDLLRRLALDHVCDSFAAHIPSPLS